MQLMQESTLNQATIDELLPVGLRNLETVRTYVNEALFFSRASQLKVAPACSMPPFATLSPWSNRRPRPRKSKSVSAPVRTSSWKWTRS